MLRARSSGVALRGDARQHSSPQVLFDYIASEIFGKTPESARDLLLRTAALPYVAADVAAALTGRDDAESELEWLYQRRLLTTRRPGRVSTYEYHPLFREFLLQRAGTALGPQEWLRVRLRAATLLDDAGQFEPAASLWIETSAWPELAGAICRHAAALISQGRAATLELWLEALPEPQRAGSPWLSYWLGMCRSLRDPVLGRVSLASAYWQFREQADRSGMAAALAGILSGFFLQWGDLRPLDGWLPELEFLLERYGPELSLPEEVQVLESCVVLAMSHPGYPRLPALLRRATELVEHLDDQALRLRLLAFVVLPRVWSGDYTGARVLCDEVGGRMDRSTPVLTRLFTCSVTACVLWQQAEHERAHELLRSALQLAQECGIRVLDPLLAVHEAYTSLSECDADAAEAMLDFGAAAILPSRAIDVINYRFMRTGVLLHRGDVEKAIAVAADNLPRAIDIGFPFGEATYRVQFGQLLMLAGRHPEANAHFRWVIAHWAGGSDILHFQACIGLAWSQFQAGDDAAALDALREALAIGARRSYMNCHPWWLPSVMSDVCARALAAGIEVDYVRRLIAKRGLRPPAAVSDLAHWPWPIRVRSLGGFELEVQEQPVRSGSKAQKKPLELLKAVLAHGPAGASHGILADQLWPDLDGDAARNALHTTLHRLRRLVGKEHALVVHDGMVGLDGSCVWTDVAALERVVVQVDHLAAPGSGPGDRNASLRIATSLMHSLLSIYRGDFLGSEELPEWAIAARTRARSRFVRACALLGAMFENAGAHGQSCDLYSRALEVTPLAEDFHRGLIRSLAAQGRTGEALDAYQRCRSALATMGAKPSATTESLARSLIS